MHIRASLLPCLAVTMLAACATQRHAPSTPAVASVRVVCTGDLQMDCFEAPSRLCGRAGYDLFDLDGKRATVGDARYRILEARCRR